METEPRRSNRVRTASRRLGPPQLVAEARGPIDRGRRATSGQPAWPPVYQLLGSNKPAPVPSEIPATIIHRRMNSNGDQQRAASGKPCLVLLCSNSVYLTM
jgi:hypothetical protein